MTVTADWRGTVGGTWAGEWRRTDRAFAGLAPILDAAIQDAAPPGRGLALDVGCGAGATTLVLAATRPDLTVLGLDVSSELVEVARARAERAGAGNARFATADLEATLPDMPAPQLIFSRHGVMFAQDPRAMFARLRAVAAPDAALRFSCFRAPSLNPWASDLVERVTETRIASPQGYRPGPFGFADDADVENILRVAGWRDCVVRAVDFEYVAGAGSDALADALSFLLRIGPVAAALRDAEDREAARERLAAALKDHLHDDRVAFPAAAWLWSASA